MHKGIQTHNFLRWLEPDVQTALVVIKPVIRISELVDIRIKAINLSLMPLLPHGLNQIPTSEPLSISSTSCG